MKKYLAILLALMLIPASALAADVKISALPEATTMAASDLFVIVDVGTNTTKKITATNFFANIPAPFTFNTGGDSYIQFETNTTYDPSSGYHLYVEGGVFKLYDGSERTILVSGQTLALGAQDLTMTGSLAATGARVTKGWFTDVESTNMPTVGGTAILSSLTAPVFTTSIEAPFIILGSAATAADAGTIRMPNAGSIQFEADPAGTDINALSVDSNEIIQIGSAGASGVRITPATKITGAATLTGGIASIGAASNLSGGTVTLGTLAGAIDAGGATSLEIPNGTGPTVDAAGEIAIDTTSDQLVYYGGAKRVLPYKQYASFVIPAPADTDDINLLKAPYGMTISAINCIVQGTTSVTGQLQECDSAGANCADLDSDITCDADGAADDGSLTDSAIAANGWLRWKTTSVSGTPTFLTVTVTYSVVSD